MSFRWSGQTAAGLALDTGILHLGEAQRLAGGQVDVSSVLAIIRGGDSALAVVAQLAARAVQWPQALLRTTDVELLAPIPHPVRNIFCVGRNYVEHVKEGSIARDVAVKLPEVPQFFTKATHTVNAPGGDIRLDSRVTTRLDYEVELAVIIGRGGRDIAAEQAFEHVFGYTVANDVTARDLQRRHEQWFKGKSLDTTLPLGPCIIDRAQIADPSQLQLYLCVNGQERQRARVAQMIFDIPTIIASLSAGLTLEPGDIIATGTPSGVGFAMQPPQFLQGGDVVVAGIDGIGELHNRVIAV